MFSTSRLVEPRSAGRLGGGLREDERDAENLDVARRRGAPTPRRGRRRRRSPYGGRGPDKNFHSDAIVVRRAGRRGDVVPARWRSTRSAVRARGTSAPGCWRRREGEPRVDVRARVHRIRLCHAHGGTNRDVAAPAASKPASAAAGAEARTRRRRNRWVRSPPRRRLQLLDEGLAAEPEKKKKKRDQV